MIFLFVKVTSMTMFSTGVFSVEPRRKVVKGVLNQVSRDVRSSRKKMNTMRVTGCKFHSSYFFRDSFNLYIFFWFRLRSHIRQAQQGAPALLSHVWHLLDVKIFGKWACRGLVQSPVCFSAHPKCNWPIGEWRVECSVCSVRRS
jgi:hypothetical protein